MKKSGWIILTLFSIFFINALVKEKEFLAPDTSEVTPVFLEEETAVLNEISTLSLSGYKKVVSENTNSISGKINW